MSSWYHYRYSYKHFGFIKIYFYEIYVFWKLLLRDLTMSITADVLQKQELITLRAHLGSPPFIFYFFIFSFILCIATKRCLCVPWLSNLLCHRGFLKRFILAILNWDETPIVLIGNLINNQKNEPLAHIDFLNISTACRWYWLEFPWWYQFKLMTQ